MADKEKEWKITLKHFGGFAPAWWEQTYPNYGNQNQAGNMQNASVIDPNALTQGPGLANLTNGSQAGVVTTLIRGIMPVPVSSDVGYAVGGNLFYQFSGSTVTSSGTWPHTINKAVVTDEDGEDVAHYRGGVFYSYNHSGSAGDVGRYDVAGATFDDDYMSTVPTSAGTLVGGVPHQMLVGGDDILYIANGQYIASLNNTTFNNQALDFPQNSVVQSLVWHQNRVFAAVNRPNVSGNNQNISEIYVWNTIASSWSYVITVRGRIGAMLVRDGVIYVWFEDISSTGGYALGYVTGTSVRKIANYIGSLPSYYQVSEFRGLLTWISGGLIYAFGATAPDLPVRLMQLADGGHATVGGLSNTFGTFVVASSDGGGNFRFAESSGFETASFYYTMMFDVSTEDSIAEVKRVTVWTEQMSAGASVATTLRYDAGKSSLALDAITQSAANTTRHVIYRGATQVEDFRLEFSWAAGSATNPVRIKKVQIRGRYIENR